MKGNPEKNKTIGRLGPPGKSLRCAVDLHARGDGFCDWNARLSMAVHGTVIVWPIQLHQKGVENAPRIVKLWPGKSVSQKRVSPNTIAKIAHGVLNYETIVSVGFEEINSRTWKEMVTTGPSRKSGDKLYKGPGTSL